MGKSTLVREALTDTTTEVVMATGDEAETDLDFGVVEQLLRCAGGDLGPWPSPPDPIVAGARLLRAFDRGTQHRPLVVVVDDAHLADTVSLEALTFAARRLGADPIVVMMTTRPDGADRVPAGFGRLADRVGAVMELGGLGVDAVGVLAVAAYGRQPPVRAIARLHRHTGGHPLHTRTLLAELGWDAFVASRELPVPTSFRTLVLSRLAGCTEAARASLAALSVLGGPVDVRIVGELVGHGDPLPSLGELESKGLVRLDLGHGSMRADIGHDLIRTAVHDDLPAGRRVALHAGAARLTSGVEAIRHRLAAATGPDAVLTADVAALARHEADDGARHVAGDLLRGAAGLAADPGVRHMFLLEAAEHLLVGGALMDDIVAEIASGPPSARRSLVLGLQMLHSGRFEAARPYLESAWQEATDAGDTALAASAAEPLAVVAVNALDQAGALEWSRRALAASGPMSAMLVCHGLALGGRVADAVEEMTAILEVNPTGVRCHDARLGRAIAALWTNRLELALDDLSSVTDAAGELPLIVYVNANAYLADVEMRLGSPSTAADRARGLLTVVDDAGVGWLAPFAHGEAAFALARLGELDDARTHADAASAVADVTGQTPARLWAEHARLQIADAEEDAAAIVAVGDGMVTRGWEALPEGVHHWRATYAAALAVVGRLDDADRAITGLRRDAAGGDASLATDAARAGAALSAARGDLADVEKCFAAGLEIDEVQARPFERARLELAAGRHRRRNRRRSAAVESLEQAVQRFASMGARVWTERCERELEASGLRPRRRSVTTPHEALTSRERSVAQLVVAGRTNREAATALIVSVKTIEHHLARIYSKLGVRSRTELAGRLLAQAGGDLESGSH